MNALESTFSELEQQRIQSLLSQDWSALDGLLDESLVYVHSPGFVHRRAELMEFFRGRIRVLGLDRGPLSLHANAELACLSGLQWMRVQLLAVEPPGVQPPGVNAVTSCAYVTQIWRRHAGAWRMALFQSTEVGPVLFPQDVQDRITVTAA